MYFPKDDRYTIENNINDNISIEKLEDYICYVSR